MDEYLEFARKIAKQSGEIMRNNFELGMQKEWKSDDTPLTVTDTAISQLVIDGVKSRFPEHGVLGEEDSFATEREYLWVVDPVDGTMPFSHGIPASVFSMALVKNGRTEVAVIADPFSDRLYWASKGQGAYVNDQKLQVNQQSELGPQVFVDIAAKFNFSGLDGIKVLNALVKANVRVTKSFTAVYNALPVVTGQHAASIVLLEFPWDGAAISLITTEAGGKVTDLYGKERLWNQNGDGFVVSNGVIHDQLLAILAESSSNSN